ncbi:MAG: peptide chain release factor N(5)-glutamine methyltransferase [Anaerolineales bacterium]
MKYPATVRSALDVSRSALGHRSETPNLDGQLLLGQILDRSRSWLMAHPESKLEEEHGLEFLNLLDRCVQGEALPHVLGWWEFYGRRFRLDGSVLIPRPETELMVDAALEYHRETSHPLTVVDVGTGSSLDALRVARKNVRLHGVDRFVRLICADLASPLVCTGGFDLLCANLPYIPEDELGDLHVAQREPRIALDGGEDGLAVVRRLVDALPSIMSPQGRALFEIGTGQAQSIQQYVSHALPQHRVQIRSDYAGRPRLVIVDR